jgi:hypothetical protein
MSLRQFTPPPYLPAFTHHPGTKIYLAGSSHVIEVFPTAIRVYACHAFDLKCIKELVFPELGPLSGWMACVDPMRHNIQIEGRGRHGFVRYRIYSTEEGVFLKPSTGMMKVAVGGIGTDVQKSDAFPLVGIPCSLPRYPTPRLLLGCNKAPNWDRISEAPVMEEVLPLWYQMSPPSPDLSLDSSSTLFGAIVESIQKRDAMTIISAFATFFRVAIDGFFVPKRTDNLFLGYEKPLLPDEMLLTQVHPNICGMVRSLFLQEMSDIINILPCLPKELVSGRLLHETLLSGHQIDIEWRKGEVRRVLLHAAHDGVVTIKARAATASIIPLHGRTRKKVFTIGEEVEVQKGKHYLLDNFST